MSGSIRLTGVNGLPLGGSGLRYPGVYAALDFANNAYELGGVSRRALTALPGFTFTRASLAMGYDATGKLTYGPNNLCLQSQTFDNAAWVKAQGGAGSVPVVTANTATAPDGTLTADTVVFTLNGGTASGDISQLQQAITSPGPSLYSFWAMTTDGTSKVFSIVGNGGTLVTITITGAWQRFVAAEPLVGASTARIRLRGSASGEGTAASASIYLWGAQLEAVTYQTTPSTYYPTTTAAYYGPRLVYDPVTLASLGILVEEARTNIALHNRDLTNAAWVKTTVTAAKNQTGIDGVANSASSITATAPAATVVQTVVLASSTRQQSAWVKRITGSGVVNMTTDGVTWTAITVTAGWTRVTIPAQATVVNPVFGFQIMTSGDAIAVDFVQNEAGTGASSPLATTTASVTRAADVPSVTGLLVGPTTTIIVEWQRDFAPTGFPQVFALSDGTSNNYQGFYISGTTIYSQLYVGAASQGNVAIGTGIAVNTPYKTANRFLVNDRRGALNGVLGTADTSDLATGALTSLYIGCNEVGTGQGSLIIKRLRIYKSAMSDAQLQEITT